MAPSHQFFQHLLVIALLFLNMPDGASEKSDSNLSCKNFSFLPPVGTWFLTVHHGLS